MLERRHDPDAEARHWASSKLAPLMQGTRFHEWTYNEVIRAALEDDAARWQTITKDERREVEFWARGNR